VTDTQIVEYLRSADVVHIATRTSREQEILTPIWSVVVDGIGYIRSGLGEGSHWYRRALGNGNVAFADGARRYAVVLERADPSSLNAIDAAYLSKYRCQSTDAVIAEPARSFTFRVMSA
jgi:hypothetical protein